jgi:dTDP-4-dehydrorhamnose 3,5-epimerase-like enzyme
MHGIEFIDLENRGDARGLMFNVEKADCSFIGEAQNIHFGTVQPGAIRGNHVHFSKRELLLISYSDDWTFLWSEKGAVTPEVRMFQGCGAVLIKIPPEVPHTIQNTGTAVLQFIALSDKEFSSEHPDTLRQSLV